MPFASVLSLYNNDPEISATRTTSTAIACWPRSRRTVEWGAGYVQNLGPGDYFVAISGAGNLDFSPVIAGSGFDGATGNYELTITRPTWASPGRPHGPFVRSWGRRSSRSALPWGSAWT